MIGIGVGLRGNLPMHGVIGMNVVHGMIGMMGGSGVEIGIGGVKMNGAGKWKRTEAPSMEVSRGARISSQGLMMHRKAPGALAGMPRTVQQVGCASAGRSRTCPQRH